MKKHISHEYTRYIKLLFLLIGLTPIVLLSFLWDDFALQGVQAFTMMALLLIHAVTCFWYATRFHYISFDNEHLYLQRRDQLQEIKLESITELTPFNLPFPVFNGKVYLVTLYFTGIDTLHKARFISGTVPSRGTVDDIPYLAQLKHAVAQNKAANS